MPAEPQLTSTIITPDTLTSKSKELRPRDKKRTTTRRPLLLLHRKPEAPRTLPRKKAYTSKYTPLLPFLRRTSTTRSPGGATVPRTSIVYSSHRNKTSSQRPLYRENIRRVLHSTSTNDEQDHKTMNHNNNANANASRGGKVRLLARGFTFFSLSLFFFAWYFYPSARQVVVLFRNDRTLAGTTATRRARCSSRRC